VPRPTLEQIKAAHQEHQKQRSGSLEAAAKEFEAAARDLRKCAARGGYSMAELQAARKRVLKAVRHDLDEWAFGSLPNERHY
jgi:hypothetical protein